MKKKRNQVLSFVVEELIFEEKKKSRLWIEEKKIVEGFYELKLLKVFGLGMVGGERWKP